MWEQDLFAQQIAPDPRHFELNGVTYTIISLQPLTVSDLVQYIESMSGEYEFEWNQGNNKASFLTRSEIAALIETLDN